MNNYKGALNACRVLKMFIRCHLKSKIQMSSIHKVQEFESIRIIFGNVHVYLLYIAASAKFSKIKGNSIK